MQYLKISFIIWVLFIVQGCVVPATTARTVNKSASKEVFNNASKKTEITKQEHVQTRFHYPHKKINYDGSIKGISQNIKYDKIKKSWLYEVRGIDTSNEKLPYVKFYYSKKLANKGDLLYVILKDSKMQDLFFIKKGNKIAKIANKSRKNKILQKRVKSIETPWIALPKVEHVAF